jgi:GxxExxY protein
MKNEILFTQVLNCAFKVHSALGPGLLESAYEECLYFELREKGMGVEKQKPMPLIYQEVKLDVGYRLDLFIEKQIVVEIKSVESLNEVHLAQILTYMKLSNSNLGLLVNFNVRHLKDGIKRIVI